MSRTNHQQSEIELLKERMKTMKSWADSRKVQETLDSYAPEDARQKYRYLCDPQSMQKLFLARRATKTEEEIYGSSYVYRFSERESINNGRIQQMPKPEEGFVCCQKP